MQINFSFSIYNINIFVIQYFMNFQQEHNKKKEKWKTKVVYYRKIIKKKDKYV